MPVSSRTTPEFENYWANLAPTFDKTEGTKAQMFEQFQTMGTPENKSEVGIISPKTAITQVNDQKKYFDGVVPENQFNAQGQQLDSKTGLAIASTPLAPPKDSTLQQKEEEARKTGRPYMVGNDGKITFQDAQGGNFEESTATYINENGQELTLTQSQLNDPKTQEFIKQGGYEMSKSDGALPGAKTTEEAKVDVEKKRMQDESQAASKKVEDLANDFLSYNVDTDPAFARQSQGITAEFDRLRRNMERVNYSRERAFETRSFRTGTAQYAGDIAAGVLGEEISQGGQRISEINQQESKAISDARTAYQTGKYTEFNNKVNALKDIRDTKTKALDDYNKALIDANKALQDQEKAILDNEKTRLENEKLFTEKATSELSRLALSGGTVSDTDKKYYESKLGLPDGSFDKYYEVVQQKEQAKTTEEQVVAAGKLVNILKDIPTGQTIQIGSDSYAGIGGNKDTQLFSETDRNGNVTYVTLDKNTGQILASTSAGQIGKGSGGTGAQNGLGGIYDQLDYRTANAVLSQADKFGTSDVVKKYNSIVAASNLIAGVDPTSQNPADHQAVVYNFAKALDPESVVREGEYATVKKYSQSLLNKYKGEIKQAISGTGFLSEQAIKDIQKATANRIKAYEPQYNNLKEEYSRKIDNIAGQPIASQVLVDYESGYQPQGGTMMSPDGKQEVNINELTPEEIQEAKDAGWK